MRANTIRVGNHYVSYQQTNGAWNIDIIPIADNPAGIPDEKTVQPTAAAMRRRIGDRAKGLVLDALDQRHHE